MSCNIVYRVPTDCRILSISTRRYSRDMAGQDSISLIPIESWVVYGPPAPG